MKPTASAKLARAQHATAAVRNQSPLKHALAALRVPVAKTVPAAQKGTGQIKLKGDGVLMGTGQVKL